MRRSRFTMVSAFIGLFLIVAAVVIIERFGILAEESTPEMLDLPQTYLAQVPDPENRAKESLIIVDETETSKRYTDQMTFILDSMDVGYELFPIAETNSPPLPELSEYQTVILGSIYPERLMEQGYMDILFNWINQGGRLFNLIPNAYSPAMEAYRDNFGITAMNPGEITIDHLQFVTDFMIGSDGFEYDLEGFSTYGMDVQMTEDSTVHVLQPSTNTPIVWEKEYGEGRIVVNNVDMIEKSSRGLLAAQYSLLMDTFAYPVINTSAFFIDDFPAPFPEGYHQYISQYYDMDLRDFFANVWLPDIMKISRDYKIPFTSVLINTYKNDVEPPFDEPVDKEFFTFYGNLMISMGGEIGFHGYNHQPLVPLNFQFSEELGYKKWNSTEDMMEALDTLVENTKWLFPKEEPSVYVPPSNILSPEAREAMPRVIEEIKTISSLYIITGSEYGQEFTVAEDGIVEFPRTISGLEIGMYDHWLAMNELNFHYVNSHFFHPDDLLDIKRGADKGWEYLREQFEEYLVWLQEVAPGLRNQRASDGAKAVQRYHAAEITRSQTDSTYVVNVENFYDGVYCIVRVRENSVQGVEGGKLTPLTSELYLLEAQQPTVTIHLGK